METLHTIISFIGIIMLLVFVHELGHFSVARWFGVYVQTFSIGFGKPLFSWCDKKGTRWQIAPIPLGGFVKMYGEVYPGQKTPAAQMPEEMRQKAFIHKPLYQRALIVLAGPLANLIFAALCFASIYLVQGLPISIPKITGIEQNSPAEAAGLRVGDIVKEVDGKAIQRFQDVQEIVFYAPQRELNLLVEREGHLLNLQVKPAEKMIEDMFGNQQKVGFLGIRAGAIIYEKQNFFKSLWRGAGDVVDLSKQMLVGVYQMISGKQGTEDLGSVIRIADMSSQVTKIGIAATIWFIAILSINLGLINLFPIPVLDGGHLMFYLYEAVMRKPVGAKTYQLANKIGMFLLMALMIFAVSNDILFFISK